MGKNIMTLSIQSFMKKNNIKLIGSGNDGDIYQKSNKIYKVMKPITKDNEDIEKLNCNEASLAQFILTNSNLIYMNILPKIDYVGCLNNHPVIIRENLVDIKQPIYNDPVFNKFMEDFINQSILEVIDYEYHFNETDFMKKWKKVGLLEEWITNNEILTLGQSLYDMIYDGILPNDINLENLGKDKNGNLKIRDMSRFQITIDNEKAWDINQNKPYMQKNIKKIIEKKKDNLII